MKLVYIQQGINPDKVQVIFTMYRHEAEQLIDECLGDVGDHSSPIAKDLFALVAAIADGKDSTYPIMLRSLLDRELEG